MLIEETLFGTVDKVADAIKRLQTFQPKDRPYWLAFSGGKDSCVILALAKMAGINYEAHYNVTSVDPPELVRFIKREYPDVSFDIQHDKDGKPITMWSLIRKNTIPPTQIARYCCKDLKESTGKGTVTITGVRWAESVNRKRNQGVVLVSNHAKEGVFENIGKQDKRNRGIILNDDNDEARRAVEMCYRTHKTLVNPIIDWEDEDVWEFIHKYNVPYCELYGKGYTRIGCIGCPMKNTSERLGDFERYPKYKDNYIRSFEKMIENMKKRGTVGRKFDNGQEVFDWWLRLKKDETPTDMVGLLDEEDDLFF